MLTLSKVFSQSVAVELNSTNKQQGRSGKHYGFQGYGENEQDIIVILYLSNYYT
jgi:hypothetical protein